MDLHDCDGPFGRLFQYDHPFWEPLLEAVGERLTPGFMWMQENELDDGLRLHAYKHRWTRRYLYLSADGQAFERLPCGRWTPMRLDFAIEAALCTWWISSGWDEADRRAVGEAVVRACEQAHSSS